MGVWITYSVRYSTAPYHPTDHEPPTYYNIAVYPDGPEGEMAALRYANGKGCKAIRMALVMTLEDAIEMARG